MVTRLRKRIIAINGENIWSGSFLFNSRQHVDNDFIVGTLNPYELLPIFYRIISASDDP
jgi:L-rhamnose isomerase